ncbi:O-antigen ligase family protein [Clostridium sp. LP20]|uniref:O-antigen ligase family protein n=1 Tax=Clostridium sp. LP20 TaxID=3418665 RepID=UPI003EE477EB
MKIPTKIFHYLTIILIIAYPILPTFGVVRGDYIIYLLILLQFIQFVISKEERKYIFSIFKDIKNNKLLLMLVILNITMYLSFFVATDKRIAISHSIRFSMYVFVFYLIAYRSKSIKFTNYITYSFISVSVLSAIVSIIQFFQLDESNTILGGNNRIASFLENSNNLGAFSILSIFIVVMLYLNSKNKKMKLFYILTIILLGTSIILSQSRNALLALIVGSFIIAILYDKRFLIASIILPVILLIIPASRIRIFQIFDLSQNSSRFKIWNASFDMISDNPILGVGYNNFSTTYGKYVAANPDNLFISTDYLPEHPHNIFLKIQSELGIVGTIIFILFILIAITTLYKGITSSKITLIKNILIGSLVSFLAFQSMNLIDCYYGAPKVIFSMFVILGISISYIQLNKSCK